MGEVGPTATSSGTTGGRRGDRWPLLDALTLGGQRLAGLILIALMVGVGSGVLSRAAFDQPLTWVIELSGAALLYMTFLSTAYVAREDNHVRVDLISTILSVRTVRWLDVLALLIQIGTMLALAWAAGTMTLENFRSGRSTAGLVSIDRWVLDAVIPVGCTLLLFQLLYSLGRVLRGLPPVDEDEKSSEPLMEF